ncbi:MAG: fused MFS/spermidine synthase [Myxococcota bacterium]|nr:fused MFS/spermidine synthase [Myxococcota bacterium]
MDLRFLLLQLCFFISGFAALLYETAWTRELAFVFGTSELAVTAVLAAYMAGLALGAAIAGRWAHRVRRPVLAYGVIELGIGLGALAVPFAIRALMGIYVQWLGGLDAPPESVGLTTALFHLGGAFLVLVPCTALMGATLPLLARHAVRSDEEVGPRIGYLYAVNTAGAICGAVTAAFLLLPALGLRQTIYVGALANGLVFGAAALLSRYAPVVDGTPARRSVGFSPVLLLIAISGMVSFVYEVLWVRLLGFVLGASTAAFATMLASFLIGISLGSALASRFATDARRAGLGFASAQLATALMAWLTFSFADSIPALAQSLHASASNLMPGAVMAVLVLLPVTICIGASFPFAVRLMAVDMDDAPSASARVYAWNTLGSIVGSVSAGFFLLPSFGFEGTLLAGVSINLALALAAALLFSSGRWMQVLATLTVLAVLGLVIRTPSPPLGLLGLSAFSQGGQNREIDFLGVGRSATVTLNRIPYALQVSTNGLPESVIQRPANPPDLYQEGRWLSLLPVLARPDTERYLIIGLGGGRTLGAVPASVREVDLIELEPEIVKANRKAVTLFDLPDPLDDPRLSLRIGDARGALMLTGKNYDAIISQPSHPWTSGASHLYTREFFELVEQRLKPGGVFVQWMGLAFVDGPLLRGLVGTLAAVFEHVTVLRSGGGAILFVSSNEKIDFLETAERAIASAPEDFAAIGVHNVTDVVAAVRLEGEASRSYAAGHPIITDDHNHLASAGGRIGSLGSPVFQQTAAELQLHDPLPRLSAGANPGLLMRILVARGARDRANAIRASLTGERQALAAGWLLVSLGRPLRAASIFEGVLDQNPSSESGRLGLALARASTDRAGDLSSAEAAVISGLNLAATRDWEQVRALDSLLAEVEPGTLAFPEAARLRARWRLDSGDPALAWEALTVLDVLITRDRDAADLLLRARAAAAAGRTEYAWASLSRLLRRLPSDSRRRQLAGGGLEFAASLERDEHAPRILRRLRAYSADRRRKGNNPQAP